ncbi:MAG TPA: fluoride efflux transporter CrcB [Chloroflexota bacterium]|nr:fluoride efflux transporter CrcB [Chloroflexota bacterium]
MQFVVIAIGATLGANLRFVVGTWAAERFGLDFFPYGTFVVNVSGAFAVGIALALLTERLDVDPLWRLFFVTGFLGGYTTFSSYAWEALALAESGAWLRAGVYVVGSNVLGFVGVWLGATLARLAPR